jgi:hypothetical protein
MKINEQLQVLFILIIVLLLKFYSPLLCFGRSRWRSLDVESACRKAYNYTQGNTNRMNTHTDIQVSRGIRTHDTSVWSADHS